MPLQQKTKKPTSKKSTPSKPKTDQEKIDQSIDKYHGWPEAFFSSSSYDV